MTFFSTFIQAVVKIFPFSSLETILLLPSWAVNNIPDFQLIPLDRVTNRSDFM